MKRFRTMVRYVQYGVAVLALLVVPFTRPRNATAADSGEYPWADATTLNAYTYDWGYPSCQPAMQQAGTCGAVRYSAGVAYYVSDPWRYALRNCTSYVAWRINHEFAVGIPGWGNANNWDNAAKQSGYRVDSQPSIGDIAVWEGYYGHVAYVTGVNEDGSVNVEQYNRAGTGLFSRESRVRANSYVHLDVVKPAPPTPTVAPDAAPKPVVKATIDTAPIADPPIRQQMLSATDKVNPLASTSNTDFTVAVDTKADQANIYAIQFKDTSSGRVEVSKSNSQTRNTSWQNTYATPILSHNHAESSYMLADYNGDSQLDLYQVKYAASTSGHTEVTVLSGASTYKDILGTWRTSEATHKADEAAYSVADYDGNGSLDLFKLQPTIASTKSTVKVIDGSKGFDKVAGAWEVDDPTTSANPTFLVGDYDRDGKADVYRIGRPQAEPHVVQAKVFDAASNYKTIQREWVVGPSQ